MQTKLEMRIAILWWELPSYLAACLHALSERHAAQVMVVRRKINSCHQWSDSLFSWIDRIVTLPEGNVFARWEYLSDQLARFQPTLVLSSGWATPEYWAATIWAKQRNAITIACMDTHWRASLKQCVTLPVSRLMVRHFDYFWIPGPLQATYAHHLGFENSRLLYGIYSCDSSTFASAAGDRVEYLQNRSYPQHFLFVGAFAPWKGTRELVQAYRLYRTWVSNPWDLHCIGGGQDEQLLKSEPGIVTSDFLQPAELAERYAQAGVFVLPSLREPHGVVVHEAATVGLPILCSITAGASLDFVRDGYNGYLFDPFDAKELARLMMQVSSGKVDLLTMGERSRSLASQLTCERWGDYLVDKLAQRDAGSPNK